MNLPTDEEVEILSETHRNVLQDLTRTIRETRGGRTIALVGPYGSGKTTLIRKLREHFHGPVLGAGVHVFIFDAWAHRADALRRGFVSHLADFLNERGLLTSEGHKAVTKALKREADVTVTLTQPRAPIAAAVFAVLALLMPIIAVVVREKLANLHLEPWLMFLSSALLLAAFVSYPLRVFAPESWTSSQSETTRGSDLTSLEFQRAFVGAAKIALAGHPKAKVVLVLDDLDRLTGAEIDEIVTALRIFVDARGELESDLFARLWFVVPFDLGEFQKRLTPDGKTNDLLLKLFDIRLRLPQPTPVHSSAFFRERFRRVFPDHTDSEAYEIFHMLQEVQGAPTLRTMTALLHDIAMRHATRCGTIPITSLAAYELIADTLRAEDLLSTKRLGGTFDEAAWRAECAALYFNVGLEESEHVLRIPLIESALWSGDGTALLALANTSGFSQFCERAIRAKLEELIATPGQLLNVAVALSSVTPGPADGDSWRLLLGAACNVKKWPIDVDLRGVGAILRHSVDTAAKVDLQRRVLQHLANGRQSGDEASADGDFKLWLKNVKAVTADLPLPADVDVVTGSLEFRMAVLRAVVNGSLVWPSDPPILVSDEDAIKKFVVGIAASPRWERNRPEIERIVEIGRNWEWSENLEAASGMISAASAMKGDHPTIGHLFEFMLTLEHVGNIDAATMLDLYGQHGGYLYHLLRTRTGYAAARVVAALITRDLADIGNEVTTTLAVDSASLEAKSAVMKFLREPDQSTELIAEVREVLSRLGIEVKDVSEAMVQVAAVIDSKGGFQFRPYP